MPRSFVLISITALLAVGCGTLDPSRETILARRSLALGPSHAEGHYNRELDGAGAGVSTPPLLTSAPVPPAVHTVATRTIATRVNLLQPLRIASTERGVAITYAERGAAGRTVFVDAETLATTYSEPFWYEEARAAEPPYIANRTARVEIGDARLDVWNDDSAGCVLARLERHDEPPALVSPPDAIVVGSPVVATARGRRVVVVFFACDGDAFSVVAAAVEPT